MSYQGKTEQHREEDGGGMVRVISEIAIVVVAHDRKEEMRERCRWGLRYRCGPLYKR